METIRETLIPINSLPKMVKIQDLIFFEGPLLSHFESSFGEQFLFYWVDSDTSYNRWLIFRTSKKLLENYLSQQITLRDLILNPDNGNVYKVEIDDDLIHHNLSIIEDEDLPANYLPSKESIYKFKCVTSDAELQTISEDEHSGVLQAYYNDSVKIGKGTIDLDLLATSLIELSDINNGLRRVFINSERAKFKSLVPKYSKRKEHKFDELKYANATKFNYFGNTARSFGALFKTKGGSSSNAVEEAYIKFLMGFFESATTHSTFSKFISGVEKSVIDSLKSLLGMIKDSNIQFNLNYINSQTNFKLSEKINYEKAERILNTINNIDQADEADKTFSGRFTALNLDTGHYRFQVLDVDGTVLETSQGHMDNDRKEVAWKIKWDKKYKVIVSRKSSNRIGQRRVIITDRLVSFIEI